jgi:hypothetical protein
MPYQIAPSWHIPYDIIIASLAFSYAQPHPGVFANVALFPQLVIRSKGCVIPVPSKQVFLSEGPCCCTSSHAMQS